jgi:hypothetical protein
LPGVRVASRRPGNARPRGGPGGWPSTQPPALPEDSIDNSAAGVKGQPGITVGHEVASRSDVRETAISLATCDMGSMRAALIYQHATTERDRVLADRLDALVRDTTDDG